MSDMRAPEATPRADACAWSIMLYTSGTTSKPKGVPRRHLAERAAGIAHVAQNLYRRGERTLGVMPLYHTMGVRSLIAMSLIGGAFVCLPRYDARQALGIIEAEKITNLYLVPTLFHDLVHNESLAGTNISSVRKLGFAGASMTDGLLKKLNETFKPELFVNHYGSSEIYTFTVDQNAVAKPGSAGKAGINQHIKVVKLNAQSVNELAATDEEGEIIALLAGDEVVRGLLATSRRGRESASRGLVFHWRHGLRRQGRRSVRDRPRRRHDHNRRREYLADRDRELPFPASGGVRGGRRRSSDEKWGKIVAAFVKRNASVTEGELEQFAASPASPNSSGRAGLSSSKRFQSLPSVSCCGDCSWPGNMSPNGGRRPAPPDPSNSTQGQRTCLHLTPSTIPASPNWMASSSRSRKRTSGRTSSSTGLAQYRVDAATRSTPVGVRNPRQGRARPGHRDSCDRRAFFERRKYRRLHGGVAGACFETRVEYSGESSHGALEP